MPTFVALLRAVNVGKRQYPMAELRAALEAAGFEDVATHIQTGNVLLTTRMRSRARVVAALEEAMLADRGFAVPVVLLTREELRAAYAEAEALGAGRDLAGHYVTFLVDPPSSDGVGALQAAAAEGEEVHPGSRSVHLLLSTRPYHETTMSNAAVERRLGVATTRNLTVVRTLVQKWCP